MTLAEALMQLNIETLAAGLQVDSNHSLLVVLQDRVDLLRHLGQVLQSRQDYFGNEVARPGNLMGRNNEMKRCTVLTNRCSRLLARSPHHHQYEKRPVDSS